MNVVEFYHIIRYRFNLVDAIYGVGICYETLHTLFHKQGLAISSSQDIFEVMPILSSL